MAGVSEATVSRVMNGVGPVREATRNKVLEAAEQLHYVPNAIAQQFARRRSGNLGVIMPSIPKVHLFSTPYFSEILSGVGETAKQAGCDMLLMLMSPDEPRQYSMLFRKRKVDACILIGTRQNEEELRALEELERDGHPFCLVNERFAGLPHRTVEADHVRGGAAACRHLIGRGCRRIAFVNGPDYYSSSLDRYEGYRHSLHEAGIAWHPEWTYAGNYSRKSGYQVAPVIANDIRQGRIDGIFAANDRMALGLLQGLKERGIMPGHDVALIGYDDSEAARYTEPQLSSVAVPFYEMGVRAASIVIQGNGINDSTDNRLEKLPVKLIARASSQSYGASAQ